MKNDETAKSAPRSIPYVVTFLKKVVTYNKN